MPAATLAQVRAAFAWNAQAQRWTRAGRFVKASALKSNLLAYAERAGREVVTLAGRMAAGEVTIGQWQVETAELLKSVHAAQYAAGRGGFGLLTPADRGTLSGVLRREYRYLERFARQVEAGLVSPARVVQRAAAYARASNATFERARFEGWRRKSEAAGIDFARPANFDPSAQAVVRVSVRKLDAAWQRDAGFYVAPGGEGGIGGRYENVAAYIDRGGPLGMSRVVLDAAAGVVSFVDGRHRFAVLRDRGRAVVPVVVPREQAAEFRRRFGPDAGEGVAVECRNLLHAAEHCETAGGVAGCVDETDRGWVPLGELSLPGERRCKNGCRCSVEYREIAA